MIIRDRESGRRYQAKRLTQSRSSQIADSVLFPITCKGAVEAHRSAHSVVVLLP
jgi:hypothetical protein